MRFAYELRRWMSIMGMFLLFTLSAYLVVRVRPITGEGALTQSQHPISSLMQDAKITFANRLKRQSKTLPEAVVEYKRRYGRNPPRGFDDWWEFAMKHDFKLVDEFDAIIEDLEPFWTLSGEELRQRTNLMGLLPSIDIVRIQDGEVTGVTIDKGFVDKERGSRARGFCQLLQQFRHKLPNMDVAINANAEGRVLVPWEHSTTLPRSEDLAAMLGNFTPDWHGQGNVWEAYRRTCPPGSAARRLYSSHRYSDIHKPSAPLGVTLDPELLKFSKTLEDDYDYCNNPWARYTQGHFFSDRRTIPMLCPLFSPAKVRGFADIRIPSHYYLGGSPRYTYGYDQKTKKTKDLDDMEMPWEEKSDLIFWRGATTGGGSTPSGFTPTYQRHRFLRMAHENADHNVTIVHSSPLRPDTFISTSVSARDINTDIMDVAFVSAVGSYPGGEQELRKTHRFADSVPLGRHWAYKYLLDLDGMSYSGRFMALMASDSAVLKSTVYKEYFSGWLEPWLHYIPLSSSYSEIYNIHAYFSGPSPSTMRIANKTVQNATDWEAVKEERDAELRLIARAGKQWKKTLGRVVDMEVYVYRLCLEYGRLWADDREAMSFMLY